MNFSSSCISIMQQSSSLTRRDVSSVARQNYTIAELWQPWFIWSQFWLILFLCCQVIYYLKQGKCINSDLPHQFTLVNLVSFLFYMKLILSELKLSAFDYKFVLVFGLSWVEFDLVWFYASDYKIDRARRARSICNYEHDNETF